MLPAFMDFDTLPLAVVESGAAQLFVVHVKAKGFNQVELESGVGTKADNVTRVGGDFRFKKYDVGHGVMA